MTQSAAAQILPATTVRFLAMTVTTTSLMAVMATTNFTEAMAMTC